MHTGTALGITIGLQINTDQQETRCYDLEGHDLEDEGQGHPN